MRTLLLCLALTASSPGEHPCAPVGFLKPDQRTEPVAAYVPHEGDLIFFWSGGPFKKALYRMLFVGPPSHVGMIVLLPNGHPVLFESTLDTNYGLYGVGLSELPARLHLYPGTIWVRRLKQPLTPEQSCRLTHFALEQQGKPFAVSHLFLPPLGLPCNGPLLRGLGCTARLDHRRWFCSGLVAASAITSGLLDGHVVRPGFVDPRDLFVDRLLDLSACWEKPVTWTEDLHASSGRRGKD